MSNDIDLRMPFFNQQMVIVSTVYLGAHANRCFRQFSGERAFLFDSDRFGQVPREVHIKSLADR